MNCLHPIYIKVDNRKSSTLYRSIQQVTRLNDYLGSVGFKRTVASSPVDSVPVPCGKCINCLKARQNALVSRCLEESDKRGSFVFLTLTYSDEYLPIAQSLWRCSKDTGEVSIVDKGEVIVSGRSKRLFGLQAEFKDSIAAIRSRFMENAPKASQEPRYVDIPIPGFEDDEYVYFSRLTPSICRKDVRLWLKKARVNFERERGKKLSSFSYVAVSEYGPNTCRPHYHLAFFGLSSDEASWLASSWEYGFIMLKTVKRVNDDGSDGFQIASRYIGKYMTKGKFDCLSVLDGSAEKPRICQSIGIGSSLIDKVKSTLCGFDMFGEFDLDTFFCPSLGRALNASELEQLCKELPKRLYYQPNADKKFKLPIPRLFRDKIFYHQFIHYEKKVKFSSSKPFRNGGTSDCKECLTKKIVREPTALWRLVSTSIRDNLSENLAVEFRNYCNKFRQGTITDACSQFAYYEASCIEISERASEARYIDFLNSSNF